MRWPSFHWPGSRRKTQSPYETLVESLLLPPRIMSILEPSFSQMGFPVTEATFPDAANREIPFHRSVTDHGVYGLVNVPAELMERQFEVVADFGTAITPYVAALFVFSPAQHTSLNRRKTADYWLAHGLADADFFLGDRISELEKVADPAERKSKLREWLHLPKATALSPLPAISAPIQRLASEHSDLLANTLASHADSQEIGHATYFRVLVKKTPLPDDWRSRLLALLSGSSLFNAQILIAFAQDQGINPADTNFTVLGSLLDTALPKLNSKAAAIVVAIITNYELYRHPELMESLRQKYQVPTETGGNGVPRSPTITWEETPGEKALHGSLQQHSLIDIKDVAAAIEHSGCVCYIEVPSIGSYGTGFLVAPDLVLTNMHVFLRDYDMGDHEQETEAKRNLPGTVFRFRYTTASEGEQEEGRRFEATEPSAMQRTSPVGKLDYALIRVKEARNVKGITHATCDPALPARNSALHILQHAPQKSLRVGFSPNGVTSVIEERGLVQYITGAVPGSSGSPCFNEHWRVVALHHAEQDYTLWKRREGILCRHILPEIESYLKEGSS